MKLRCGRTQEQIDASHLAWLEYVAAREKWHTWYAWFPVSIARGQCRWLETVERKRVIVCGDSRWRYRVGEGDGYVAKKLKVPVPEIALILVFIAALFPW